MEFEIEVPLPDPIEEHLFPIYRDRSDELDGWQAWFANPRTAILTFLLSRWLFVALAGFAFYAGRGGLALENPGARMAAGYGVVLGFSLYAAAEAATLELLSVVSGTFLYPFEVDGMISDRFAIARMVLFGGQSVAYLMFAIGAAIALLTTDGMVLFW